MSHVIGIDEVGRGPLAGPVVVCALVLSGEVRIKNNELGKLRDSKQLTELQREAWFLWIKKHPQIKFAVARVYPRGIERLNISQAANLAATRAVMKLATSHLGLATKVKIFLDGGLYLNRTPLVAKPYTLVAKTIIKADEKYNCVKLASIVAKVTRDRFMNKLHKKYPQYGFRSHKGYGTKAHILAIKKHGISAVHRASFVKNFIQV